MYAALGLGLGLVYLAHYIKDKTIQYNITGTTCSARKGEKPIGLFRILSYMEKVIRLKVHLRTIQKNTIYQEGQLCNKEIKTQSARKKENRQQKKTIKM